MHVCVFAGWVDARWARVIVGGEIKKGARGLSWRHSILFDRFLVDFQNFPFFAFLSYLAKGDPNDLAPCV